MAVIDPDSQVRDLYQSADPRRIRLCAVTNVTTGDTLDCSSRFSKILATYAIPLTGGAPAHFPPINGHSITMAQAGIDGDTMLLLIMGGWA